MTQIVKAIYLGILLLAILPYKPVEGYVARIITELLQNVVAQPVAHQRTNWDFDPNASEQRRNLYYEKHGYRGAKFIESIGVGVDGLEKERRSQQAVRDEGRLNGEHFINFP